MEQVKITFVNHYRQDDFDELNVRINDLSAQATTSEVADDEHNAFLQVNPETHEIVGATILYAQDWFAEIAEAFQRADMSHPAVVFFLEQKISAWIAQQEKQRQIEPLPV